MLGLNAVVAKLHSGENKRPHLPEDARIGGSANMERTSG